MQVLEGKRKNVRSTARQIQALVDYMSTNPVFANGDFQGPLGIQSNAVEWTRLKALLAEFGPNKSVEQWKQTWKDIKKKARHENAASSLASAQTGNNVPVPTVSDTSQKVLSTIGLECSVGMGPMESPIGGSSEGFVMPEQSLPEQSLASTPPIASTASRSRRRVRTVVRHNASATEFVGLQKENNSHLKVIIKLMEEKNEILREQNRILKRRYPSPTPE